jgi:hypothetical protein
MEKSLRQPRLLDPIPKRTFFRELGFFSKNRREWWERTVLTSFRPLKILEKHV